MAYNPFATVEALRDHIDVTQSAQIKQFYSGWAEELEDLAKHFDRKTTSSSGVSSRYYRELKQQVQTGGDIVAKQVQGLTTHNMFVISDAMVKSNVAWLAEFGFPKEGLNAAFSYVPTSVVNSLVTGQVYGKPGSWNLSSAIWSSNKKVQSEAYRIVAQGVAQNMPISEIAKSLSSYINPEKKLLWTGPNGTKIYGKAVDYSAQRLARTLVQHTYQQSFVAMTKNNPFVEVYRWIANGVSACPICGERDGKEYKKNELPLDHPNGMCVMEPVIDPNMVDKLADWVNSEDGTYPEIDEFAKNFGYTPSKKQVFASNMPTIKLQDIKDVYGHLATSKGLNTWYQKLPDAVKSEVKLYKQQSGKTWDEFYQTEIFEGGKEAYDVKFGVKVLSFDDAYKAYEAKLLQATKNGKYLGKMSKEEFIKLLSASDTKKIGDVDDFVSQAFTKLGAKSGNSVSTAVKSKASQVESVKKAEVKLSSKNESLLNAIRGIKQSERYMLSTENYKSIWTEDELSAVRGYTGESYHEYNRFYREMATGEHDRAYFVEKYGEKMVKDIELAAEAMKKLSTKEDYVLRRGTSLGDIAGLFMQGNYNKNAESLIGKSVEELNAMFNGSVGEYAGFTSTSSLWGRGFNGNVEVIIKAPAGTHGSSIMHISQYGTREGEFLLAPGTKVKCLGIEQSDGHKRSRIRMFLEVIV